MHRLKPCITPSLAFSLHGLDWDHHHHLSLHATAQHVSHMLPLTPDSTETAKQRAPHCPAPPPPSQAQLQECESLKQRLAAEEQKSAVLQARADALEGQVHSSGRTGELLASMQADKMVSQLQLHESRNNVEQLQRHAQSLKVGVGCLALEWWRHDSGIPLSGKVGQCGAQGQEGLGARMRDSGPG